MRQIICTGPAAFDIGHQHGTAAKHEVDGSITFYQDLFRKTAKLEWNEVLRIAEEFDGDACKSDGLEDAGGGEELNGTVKQGGAKWGGSWRGWRDEMRGIAAGAGVPYSAILALNIRTEIAYGMARDGCTAISWRTPSGASLLAQNWDWQEEQRPNLIHLCIRSPPQPERQKPSISMITEAGIIGKIGLNDKGVGVCLNAIAANGVDFARLPVHLALRACLESESADQAANDLQREGVASACHILVMDGKRGIGLECSSKDVIALEADKSGMVTHTNHFLKTHSGVEDKIMPNDSPERLERVSELIKKETQISEMQDDQKQKGLIRSILKDEENSPLSICRSPTEKSPMATLFSIVMDLTSKTAEVTVGKPSNIDAEIVHLHP